MPKLEISLLGPFQIRLAGEAVRRFKTIKVQALLAYLAMESRHPQAREALAELLWPEQSETAARLNLRQTLYRLRQIIPVDYLRITRKTIQFNPDSDQVLDVGTFTELVSTCRRHLHLDLANCLPCLTRLQEAVRLYRGDFLADFSVADSVVFDEWVRSEREWLRREVLQALYQLADYHKRYGDYEAACAYARRQVELDSLREEAYQQLIHSLALSGHRIEALAQYDICRRVLAEELGIEPGPETSALYERVRDGQIGLEAAEQARQGEFTTVHHSSSRLASPHNLPSQPTPLIGRDKELAEIDILLAGPNCRLLTIAGPGGIGKTRLSIEVAHLALTRFAEGAYFVSLASTDSVEDIMPRIATAVNPETYPVGRAAADFMPQLQRSDPQILLVLDNLEQLLPAGTAVIEALLSQTRHLKLLVTSREVLNIRWEWRYDLGTLSYPTDDLTDKLESYGAIAMFLQRMRQTRREPLSEDEAHAVAQICRLVGGMPLGIELAAAQAGGLSCTAIAGALARNLDVLAALLRDLPTRQRSLRASFEVTWGNLSSEEQAAFRRLSLFRSSFNAEAAQAIAKTDSIQLVSLINKSLLRRVSTERYNIHEVLRHFAKVKLAEHSAEKFETLKRYQDYYTAFLNARVEALEEETKLTENIAAFYVEIDNLWAGWEWIMRQDNAQEFASALVRALSAVRYASYLFPTSIGLIFKHQQQLLESRSSEMDICLIDVIWTDTLADHLLDLSQDFGGETQDHFSIYIENNTVNGRLVAIPYSAELGLLHYRSDLLAKYGFAAPPATWDELETMAAEIQAGERAAGRADFWGFIWQGGNDEGLTCNALEWQVSHGGGRLIEPDEAITVNNPQTIAAFERAAGWLGTISPLAVTKTGYSAEMANLRAWTTGNVAFMRNWANIFIEQIDNPTAKDRIGITALPSGGAGPAAILGGEQIAISKYVRHPQEAIELVRYATSHRAQLDRVVSHPFWPPTILKLYDQTEVMAIHPHLPRIKQIFTSGNIVVRPSKVCSKLYPQVSKAYATAVHSILIGQVDAATAVADLEAQLVEITGFEVG